MTSSKKRKAKRNLTGPLILVAIVVLVIVGIVIFILTRHKHTPGPEATCTTDQVCEECGEVLEEAFGHTEGAAATCTEPMVCEVCGEVLEEALGHLVEGQPSCQPGGECQRCGLPFEATTNHDAGANGVCSICNEQILPAGCTVYPAGAGNATSDDTSGAIEETLSGHYEMSDNGYYSKSVMIGGDYGLEYFRPKSGGCTAWADVVNRFAEKYPNVNVTAMIVPKCAAYHTPSNYTNPHDNIAQYISETYALLNDGIITPDAMGEMDQHETEYMFYRTDHHWTSLGAYYASRAYCQANGIAPYELSDYETTIQTGFTGTLYHYSGGNSTLKSNPDYTVFHYPHVAYTMQYSNGAGFKSGKVFDTEKSGYASAFIMGDQAVEVFTTGNSNGKVLMMFKESYGNCFAPYMIDYYSKVIVVDCRTTALSVQSMIAEYGVTDVLFLNNVQAVPSLNQELKTRCMN